MMLKSGMLFAAVVVMLGTESGFAADWPTGRLSYHRNPVTFEKLPATLAVSWKWRSATPPQPAWHGPAREDAYMNFKLRSMRNYDLSFDPIIIGNSVYWCSTADNSLYAGNLADGTIRWRFTTGGRLHIAPTFSNGKLYFGSDDGYAYCVDAATGNLVWRYSPSEGTPWILNDGVYISRWPCRAGVVVDKNIAYLAFSLMPWNPATVCAVDASTGKVGVPGTYVRKLDGLTLEGLPLLVGDNLLYPQGRTNPVLVKKSDGAQQGLLRSARNWSAGGYGGCFLTFDEGRVVFGPGNNKHYGDDTVPNQSWGAEVYSLAGGRKLLTKFPDAIQVAFDKERAYALTPNGPYAVAKDKPKRKLWSASLDACFVLIKAGETVYVGHDGGIAAFAGADGEKLWDVPIEGRVCSLAAGNASLIAGTDVGVVACLKNGSPAVASEAQGANHNDRPHRKAPAKIADDDLFDCWNFSESRMEGKGRLRDETGRFPARISGNLPFRVAPGCQSSLELDGKSTTIRLSNDISECKLPTKAISVVAWCRIDAPLTWGGIIGAFQDNGSFERGWVLGYSKEKFTFGIAAGKASRDPIKPRMTYLTAPSPFEFGTWYCVAGTYDGKTMRLYVDGKPVASSSSQQGDIHYPDSGYYEIGAYHDDDENFNMTGALNEIRVYSNALTSARIAVLAAPRRYPSNRKLALDHPPITRYLTPSTAEIAFETSVAGVAEVDYSFSGKRLKVTDSKPERRHKLVLTELPRNRAVEYRITFRVGDQTLLSETWILDTEFNFTKPRPPKSRATASAAETAARILRTTKRRRGICVVSNGDWKLAREIARLGNFDTFCLCPDEKTTAAIREALFRTDSFYGSAITAATFDIENVKLLPGGTVTLFVDESDASGKPSIPIKEVDRLLSPLTGTVVLITKTGVSGPFPANAAGNSTVAWRKASRSTPVFGVRGALPRTGSWTHQYGKPDNSGYGGEWLGGADAKEALKASWIGRPGPRFRADRSGRGAAPLAVNGRLFVLGLGRVMGIDAYTGTPLWSMVMPDVNRFNIHHDSGNWCADSENLYIPYCAGCVVLDASTGNVERFLTMPEDFRKNSDWSYVARAGGLLFGSATRKGSRYTDFHGAYGWYDAKGDNIIAMVCSSAVFAVDPSTGETRWSYRPEKGVVLNPTITIADGAMFFVESNVPKLLDSTHYRFTANQLAEEPRLTALDAKTGKKRWSREITINDDTKYSVQAVWLAAGDGLLVYMTSRYDQKPFGTYYLTVVGTADGKTVYKKSFKWPAKDHGGHLSRPVIVDGTLFIKPKAMNIHTGAELAKNTFWGACGTYVASEKAVFNRAAGCITMWRLDSDKFNRSSWHRLRPSCWISLAPACGMLLAPEGGGGCRCGVWIETSVGFAPKSTLP